MLRFTCGFVFSNAHEKLYLVSNLGIVQPARNFFVADALVRLVHLDGGHMMGRGPEAKFYNFTEWRYSRNLLFFVCVRLLRFEFKISMQCMFLYNLTFVDNFDDFMQREEFCKISVYFISSIFLQARQAPPPTEIAVQ